MADSAETPSGSIPEPEGMLRSVADIQSPKIKQESRCAPSDPFSANPFHGLPNISERQISLWGLGHASYREEESTSSLRLLDDFAQIFHTQASPTTAACRGYKQALQAANLLPNASNEVGQASHAGGELRYKTLESEVKRLKQQLVRSEDSLRLKNEEVYRVQRELESSRRTVGDLRDTVVHQKELILMSRQVVAEFSQTKNEPPETTYERPQSPQPATAIKRARPDSPVTSQSNATLKPLSEDVSQGDTANPPKRPRYSSERATSDLPVRNGPTLRGSDFYDPPYAAKKQEIDRYVPAARSNNWLHDRYDAPSPTALGPTTTNINQALPANPGVPQALLQPSSAVVAPNSGGASHPFKLKGSAGDAFLRAQRLGVQYDPANHIGIPRPCTICGAILPSGGKLDQHMVANHRGHRGLWSMNGNGPYVQGPCVAGPYVQGPYAEGPFVWDK